MSPPEDHKVSIQLIVLGFLKEKCINNDLLVQLAVLNRTSRINTPQLKPGSTTWKKKLKENG